MEPIARITLELELDAPSISGRVRDAAGDLPFSGWLALVAALEAARLRGLDAATPTDAGSGPSSSNRKGV